MTASVITGRLEIELVPGSGTYTDISVYMIGNPVVQHPRAYGTAATATTFTVVLDNSPDKTTGISPFNPDNALSPLYPNIQRDRRIRFTYLWNAAASSSRRFSGWIDTVQPDGGSDGTLANATVTITASCILSRYARRTRISEYGEGVFQLGALQGGADYWALDDEANAVTVRGLSADGYDTPSGIVFPPVFGSGSMSLGRPDSGILVDGAATFTRGNTGSASPVIQLPLRQGVPILRVSAWVLLTQDPAGLTDDILGMYDAQGNFIWRLIAHINAGNVEWQICDGQSPSVAHTFFNTGFARDEAWHWLSVVLFDNGTGIFTTQLAVRDQYYPDVFVAGGTAYPAQFDIRFGAWLVVGGIMYPQRQRKQTNTLSGSVASVEVRYTSSGTSVSDRSAGGLLLVADNRLSWITQSVAALDALVGGQIGNGAADPTPVMLTGATSDALAAFNEHALTVNGQLFTRPDGQRHWKTATQARPLTPSVTLDATLDLHMPAGGWALELRELPTRATGSGPVGSITVVDTARETATSLRQDAGTISTGAGSLAVAEQAAWRTFASRKARLSSFGVDTALTSTDKTAALMAMLPYDRLRITGLPTATMGVTQMDVYASGWSETLLLDGAGVVFTFDTDPADDPPEAVFDDSEYGRFASGDATVTGGTCVGNTGTGTLTITSTDLFVTGQSLDLDWNGERVTVSGISGASSPQTATVTARGVVPTVARVHASGEIVDTYHAMNFA